MPHDLTDAIPIIDTNDEKELAKIFALPIVVKYFRAMGMTAVFEQAKYPYHELADNNNLKLLLELAYQKGVASMADTILNYTPSKELNNGSESTR